MTAEAREGVKEGVILAVIRGVTGERCGGLRRSRRGWMLRVASR